MQLNSLSDSVYVFTYSFILRISELLNEVVIFWFLRKLSSLENVL